MFCVCPAICSLVHVFVGATITKYTVARKIIIITIIIIIIIIIIITTTTTTIITIISSVFLERLVM